jgi:hypothetical protein
MRGRCDARTTLAWLLFVSLAVLRVWLGSRQLQAIGFAWYDDRWFLDRALDILSGRWLGPYNERTLMKGPVYPLFVAAVSSQRIPLLIAQQTLYAVSCIAAMVSSAPLLRGRLCQSAFLAVLLFNPMSFADDVATRVTREGFYQALTLLVAAGLVGFLLRLDERNSLRWSMLLAIAFALSWHTREESVWVVPLLAFGLAALLVGARRSRAPWSLVAKGVGPTLVAFVIVHLTVVCVNGYYYGTWDVIELKEASFLRAYSSLTRVRQHPRVARVPVPREVRDRVYAVSPAFAELRGDLEGSLGNSWKRGGDDLPAESFLWAFREAVAHAGYYRRGSGAVRRYYERLASEVDAARRAGKLDADVPRLTLAPPIVGEQRRQILREWFTRLLRTPQFPEASVTTRPSLGTDDELRLFAETTRSEITPREEKRGSVHLTGWALHVNGAVEIRLDRTGGHVTRLPSPDVHEHLKSTWRDFPPAKRARFDIVAPADASLVLTLKGTVVDRISLAAQPIVAHDQNIRFIVDVVEDRDVRVAPLPRPPHGDLLNGITGGYRALFPALLGAASLLYFIHLKWVSKRRPFWIGPLIVAGLFSAVAFRVLLLAVIDVTSYAVFFSSYVAPSYPLLLMAAMLMACDALSATVSRLRSTG